ncbi:MAG: PilZ domain-containing protein [Planctomycetota bacterium]|jgi:hypothetical protein
MRQDERRRHPRVDIDLPLRLTISDQTVETRITNISNSGIRFRTHAPLALMSRVQIALELPDTGAGAGSLPLAITGVVVRCEQAAGSAETPYDTAIYFEDLSDRARGQLAQFVGSKD